MPFLEKNTHIYEDFEQIFVTKWEFPQSQTRTKNYSFKYNEYVLITVY